MHRRQYMESVTGCIVSEGFDFDVSEAICNVCSSDERNNVSFIIADNMIISSNIFGTYGILIYTNGNYDYVICGGDKGCEMLNGVVLLANGPFIPIEQLTYQDMTLTHS